MTSVLLVLGGGSSWFRGGVHIERSADRLVLEQGPSMFVKIVVIAWPLLLLLGAYLCYRVLFKQPSTTFACDRASGTCSLDGSSEQMPALADITGAEIEVIHRSRQGDFRFINLLLKDGKKKTLSQDGAQRADSVASYKAAVAAIEKFLADPSQAKLETSFIYHASLWEKFWNVSTWLGAAMVYALVLGVAMTRTYTFDRTAKKLIAVDHKPIYGDVAQEITFDRIAEVMPGPPVELKLKDGAILTIASGDDAGALGKELAELVR